MRKNEKIEWMDLWWDDADAEGKRLLIIGDSISRDGYYPVVCEHFKGRYHVDRCSTSAVPDAPVYYSLLDLFLRRPEFDYEAVSINIGPHGTYIPDGEFCEHIKKVIDYIRSIKPDIKIILCTVTPNRVAPLDENGFGEKNKIYFARGEIYKKIGAEQGLTVVDFYREIIDHKIMNSDGIHFRQDGYQVLGNALIKGFEKIL